VEELCCRNGTNARELPVSASCSALEWEQISPVAVGVRRAGLALCCSFWVEEGVDVGK
jgi:hypothetical protein